MRQFKYHKRQGKDGHLGGYCSKETISQLLLVYSHKKKAKSMVVDVLLYEFVSCDDDMG